MSAPTLYFVRHGETDWNAAGRLQGQTDTPLNGLGRAQAEQVGRMLVDLAPDLADLDFVASPLSRTRETMQLLRRNAGLPDEGYRTDERWMELAFGSWEGHGWKDLRRLHPKLYAERERDRWVFTPPGGGESYATLVARVGEALAALVRDTVVVSHGGVARVVMTILAGVAASEALGAAIWQGRILLFQDGRHRWV